MQQFLVDVVRLLRVRTCASGDRLGALALAVAEDSERVHRKRLALAPILQVRADPSEELLEPRGRGDLRGLWAIHPPLTNLAPWKTSWQ